VENGTLTSYAYDDSSKLTQVKHFHSAFVVAQFDYTLDAVDRRTQKAVTGSVPNRVEEYECDDIDQIAKADYGGRDEVFHYDAAGNRTSVVDSALGTTSYSTNTLNQYTSVGGVSVSHDSKGNLAASGGWAYTYDSKNRLLTAVSGTMGAAFVYDSRNRQVSRTINGATTYFIWDGWDLIEERDGTGAVLQKYVHGSGTDEILAKISGTSAVYYHHDGLGSVIALTREDGSLAESYQYDVFGLASVFDASGASISTSGWANRFLFTGREWIDEADLYDYRNRVYQPILGRFMQADPVSFSGDDVNLYRYVSNNPTSWVDPLGLYITYAPGNYDNWKKNFDKRWKDPKFRDKWNEMAECEEEFEMKPDRADDNLDDPATQFLIDEIWRKTDAWTNRLFGSLNGAKEYYGFSGSGIHGPFEAKNFSGGYMPPHDSADPAGTTAGYHSHPTNNPAERYSKDSNNAWNRKRPEYVVTKDYIYRIRPSTPGGEITRFPR
jgi:RHS repeat-associated protein